MNEQSALQFRFKPRRFRRHLPVLIGNAHQLVHRRGMTRQHDDVIPFSQAGEACWGILAADEIDSVIGANFCDVKIRFEHISLQRRDV